MFAIDAPMPQYFDLDGTPLDDGRVYIGLPGQDPITNPVSVFYDAAGTIPAPQPLRTMNGFIARNGIPALVFFDDEYSILVRDSRNRTVLYVANATITSGFLAFALELASSIGSSLIGFLQAGVGAVLRTVQSKLREVSYSITDFGAVCDGSTNDTAAVQAAITAIGTSKKTLYIPGPTKIAANITFGFNTSLQFARDGRFIGTAGTEVIQVQRQIIAEVGICFENCVPSATTAQVVYPEWFGALRDGATGDQAAFIAAYYYLRNVGGTIQMQPGDYGLTATITGVKTKVVLRGAGRGITRLLMVTANTNAIQAYGTASPNTLNFIGFRDFTIRLVMPATAGCFGLDVQFTTQAEIHSVEIADFLFGYKIKQTTNAMHTQMLCTYQGNTNGFIGYVIDGDGGSLGNASTKFVKCDYNGNANISAVVAAGSIGVRLTGAYLSDLTLDFEGTFTAIGTSYDGSTAGANVRNVHMRLTLDQFLTQGLYISNVGASGQISVEGGWINAKTTGAETNGVLITNCRGITFNGGLVVSGTENIANAYGFKIANSADIIIDTSVQICDMNYGISGNATGACTFSPRFYNTATAATSYVTLVGDARSFVDGASLDGFATNGVIIDATSSGSGITCNKAITTNIGTRFTNLAAGPIGGVDGGTGLNSGI